MKDYEILEKFTQVDSEYYELYRARTLIESPEFYLQLISDIRKLVKEYDPLPCGCFLHKACQAGAINKLLNRHKDEQKRKTRNVLGEPKFRC